VTTAAQRPPVRFGIVGSGWRTQFYLRMARLMPERFRVTGVVTRAADRGREVEQAWGVPTHRTIGDLLAAGEPEFVLVSVPRAAAPAATVELAGHGVQVLCETPPAPDVPALRELWAAVGSSGPVQVQVQVAEQYLMMPSHAARWALVRAGTIGTVTSVQVSSTHMYHAVSMIRHMLGVGFSDVDVTARAFSAPLADPLSREGWVGGTDPRPALTTLALLDFGEGRSGVYDFTDNQWFNPLRGNRIVIRGSHGEIVDDRVTRLVDPVTVIESALVRRQTGIDLNLEGFDLDHISHDGAVAYRNPYQGARLAEDDISVATLLDRMGEWCRGDGPEPYPLADACQDHLVALAVEESALTGATVRTTSEPWAA
jgi:predicted dehydrogenase